jgi:hypothetical protein
MGTSTQLGKNVSVKVIIDRWSTKEDQQTSNQAFRKGHQQGLVNALKKMKSLGRIQIPGTLGYDIAYAVSASSPAAPIASSPIARSLLARPMATPSCRPKT